MTKITMNIHLYLEEAIRLELNVADLYSLFAQQFEEDYNFWWKLSNEEMNHASILKTGIEFSKLNKIPQEIIPDNIDGLISLNEKFPSIIDDCQKNPNRQKCFEVALEIESSAGESHYQEIMIKHTDNDIVKIFQKLNKDDIDHYNRIKEYYSKNLL